MLNKLFGIKYKYVIELYYLLMYLSTLGKRLTIELVILQSLLLIKNLP